MEVEAGDSRIILDAGTGIRLLGEKLGSTPELKQASIFLTHFHWDHIHGFPFFAPAYDPDFQLRILGPSQEGAEMEALLRAQMGPVYFPIPYDALTANITYEAMNEDGWEQDGVRLSSMRVRHTSNTVGYRLDASDRSVVYIPDNELEGGDYAVPHGWMDQLVEFVSDADLLLHDAMFTAEEYRSREGWGHSTFSQALRLAERAGIKSLYFFHHAPKRTDEELGRIVQHYREEVGVKGLKLDVHAASEGNVMTLGRETSPG